jgi:hypothetical protein
MMIPILLNAWLCVVAPVPPASIAVAPPPHVWKPDATLLLVEWLAKPDAENRYRLVRMDFRNGVARPAEVVWEGEDGVLGHYGGHQVLADRYLVTRSGCVIDIHAKKLVSEGFGEFAGANGLKVFHKMEGDQVEKGVYEFDVVTRKLTRVGDVPLPRWSNTLSSSYRTSPDWRKAITCGSEGELVLHREGEKPKSLGKGFKDEPDPELVVRLSLDFGPLHVFWLDDTRILTQRANGKLVTLTLDGTVTELMTIKEAQKKGFAGFARERDGRLVYTVNGSSFVIDVDRKKWEKTEWESMGDGFEASRRPGKDESTTIRYKGKEIGQFQCIWQWSKTAPGHIAFPAEVRPGQQRSHQPNCVMAWSARSGEWTTLKFENVPLLPVVGWIEYGPPTK